MTTYTYLQTCFDLADQAVKWQNAPVGSVVVKQGEIIGRGIEQGKSSRDVTRHAEIEALKEAVYFLGSTDLSGCVLHTTHEPCIMCSYVTRSYKISEVVILKPVKDVGGWSSTFPVLRSELIEKWGEAPKVRFISDEIILDTYQARYQTAYEALNSAWISELYTLEPIDIEVLKYPEKYILEKGGQILVALLDDQVIGTAALLKTDHPFIIELGKMTVDKRFRGIGIANKLMEASIKESRKMQAQRLELYSQSRLHEALTLYKKYGFIQVSPRENKYARADVYMFLELEAVN